MYIYLHLSFSQIIDRHVGEQGEVIANIPIKISAKAVFSKFALSPLNEVNFGSIAVGVRKQCSFTLENKGMFEFKYAIVKRKLIDERKQKQTQRGSGGGGGGGGGGTGKSGSDTSIRTEVLGGSQKLVLGIFTISPAMGTVSAGQSTVINVDCAGDKLGKQEVELVIEISDRSKKDPAVVYHIFGDVLEPSINTSDVASIFEEHGVCQSLGVLGAQLFHRENCVGVYGELERRFAFKSVTIGQSTKAHFKISNPSKIPCDVKLALSPVSTKQKAALEAFEVEPKPRFTIPSHSHVLATVTFKPMAIQTYTAIFEASPDSKPDSYKQSLKPLTFELQGEGNLPQIAILHPTLKNAKGQPLLLFKRLLKTHSQTLRVTLKNTGTISATAHIQIKAGKQHYSVVLPDSSSLKQTVALQGTELEKDRSEGRPRSACPLLLIDLAVEETRDVLVVFCPAATGRCRGELCMRIQDNLFEALSIQLVGESYEDDVSIQNIRGGAEKYGETAVEEEEELMKLQPEEVEGIGT